MKAKVEFLNEQTVIRTTRTLREPSGMDKAQSLRVRLSRVRKHRRQWPLPHCEIIFNMHFSSQNPEAGKWYGEMNLEIPQDDGFDYYTIVRGAKTEEDSLIAVIRAMESEEWFHSFRKHGARFRITGSHLVEYLYKGYL